MNKKVLCLLILMLFVTVVAVFASEHNQHFEDYIVYTNDRIVVDDMDKCLESIIREILEIESEDFNFIHASADDGIMVNANEYLEFIMNHIDMYSDGVIEHVISAAQRDCYVWIVDFNPNGRPNTFEEYRDIMLRRVNSTR